MAIKAISMARLNKKLIEGLTGEITVMKEIQHENIVQLLEVHVS